MNATSPVTDATPPTRGPGIKLIVPLVVVVAILGGATLLLTSGSTKPTLPGNAATSQTARYSGFTLSPLLAAPPLDSLRNYDGARFNLATDRGNAVFVTFIYAHCPDVCPLIASHLHTAYATMPATLRRRVAIIAVSVDPHGDTVGTVAAFVRQHELTGEASYLIGSARQLVPVWKAWRVGSQSDTSHPDLVNHSALVFGVSAHGKLVTIYPANFKPSDIVHDVPALLAR